MSLCFCCVASTSPLWSCVDTHTILFARAFVRLEKNLKKTWFFDHRWYSRSFNSNHMHWLDSRWITSCYRYLISSGLDERLVVTMNRHRTNGRLNLLLLLVLHIILLENVQFDQKFIHSLQVSSQQYRIMWTMEYPNQNPFKIWLFVLLRFVLFHTVR